MYTIPANALFLGNRIIYLPECHSTNDFAGEIVQQPSVQEGAVVITDHQTQGRGQRGADWVSEPGMNLTFSLVLRPSFLEIKQQFLLNSCVALGVYDLVKSELDTEVYIKWPNDIVAGAKKICGILVENQLRGSTYTSAVAGIGLNVNQQQFPFLHATSLSLLKKRSYELNDVLGRLLERIEARYLSLRQGNAEALNKAYTAAMYWLNEPHTFSAGGKQFEGIIKGLDDAGRLRLETDGGERVFAAKEIAYVI